MNRSGSRNRRNNGNRMPLSSARQNLHQPTENEPIMMEYLQHIDRELNELKKKREIIEQQHGYFQSPMEDGHNRPDQKRELLCSTTRYYEQFYDDPEPSHSSYYKESYGFPAQNDDYISFNSGRKRPNPWQNNDEPKRFSGFDGDNVEKLFGSRLGPKTSSRYFNEPVNYNQRYRQHKNTAPSKRNAGPSQKPKPLMSYDVRDSYSSARKEYRSKNKISKPKAASARPPNKLNAYPVATRKDLIEKTTKADAYPVATRKALAGSTKQADASPVATQKASAEPSKQADACPVTGQKASVGPTSKASADNDASMILKTDGNLTPKIRGRLELALGHILKSMKEKKSMEDKADIGKQSINMQRIVKQIIRERLKNVMLGKRVGSYVEIAAAYRERFPVDTDEKMLIAAHGTALSNIKYKTADSAEEFLKLNIHDVLEKKLREMFQQLEEIYSGMKKSLKGEDKVEIKDATATSEDKDATASTSVDKNATASTSEDKNATASTSEDKNATASTSEDKNATASTSVDKNATASTSEDKNATASTSEDKNATASTSEDKDATASTSEDKDANASTSEDKDATASTSEDKDATDSTSEDKDMVIIKDVLDNGGIPEECKKLMFPVEDLDNILDEKLPKLLMSFIPRLTEIMKLDYRYESSTAEVIINTNGFKAYSKRLQQITRAVAKGVSGNNKKEKKSNNVQAMTGEEQTNTSPMYYLKLIGRPTLPKRKPMQSFLDKFKPTMIKKHKKQSNLLFIGFTDKKYYDHLLSKNGASFGKIIIDIKPSEPTKTNGGAAENETSGADTKDGESSQPNEENDTSFDSELDDQINELLLSIRQSEEDNDSDIVEPTTAEMTQSGNYDSDDKDQNRVTIIYDSDDEKNEEKTEDVAEKTEDITEKTEDITEKMEVDTANMDDITEETEDVTEKTNDGTEKTDDITEEKDDVDEKTDNITEEDEDVADKTDNITEENEDVADKTDNITDGSEAVADKTNDITEEDEDVADKIEDITEEKEDVTEKTDEAIKTTPELVVKVENDVQIETSSEKDTIDEDNMQQVKEQVTSNEEGQANTEDVEAVSKNEENSVQNDSDNVKDAKKDGIVKESVRATPTRTSSRLATVKPTTIQTRRASRMTQNNE